MEKVLRLQGKKSSKSGAQTAGKSTVSIACSSADNLAMMAR